MAGLIKRNGMYYLAFRENGKEVRRSLGTNSKRRAEQLRTEYESRGPASAFEQDTLTVGKLRDLFTVHAVQHYRRPDGSQTSTYTIVEHALKHLDPHADRLVADCGPRWLREIRDAIQPGRSISTVNGYVGIIVRMFRWGMRRELVSPAVVTGLDLEPLEAGRCEARAPERIEPVPQESIDAVLPLLSRPVAAMVRLQLLTGARSGELLALRPCDIDRTGPVWSARIEGHKTAHRGRQRVLFFGPQAQDILKPFLLRPEDQYLFRPIEAVEEMRARRAAERVTPIEQGNRPGTNCQGTESYEEHYTPASYRKAVQRACKAAGVEVWHPHQLRHTAGTLVRDQFGLDGAQAYLGHAHADVTQIYAEVDAARAREIAARLG